MLNWRRNNTENNALIGHKIHFYTIFILLLHFAVCGNEAFQMPRFFRLRAGQRALNQEARTASVRNKCRRHSFSSAFKTSVAAWRTSSAGSVAFISFNVGVIRGA